MNQSGDNIARGTGQTGNTPLTENTNSNVRNSIPIVEEKTIEEQKAGQTIQVIEEQVQITKEIVESGKVRISKTVQEVEEMIDMPISYEEHDVQRIPINKLIASAPPAVRHEGDTIIIPVIREELVVQKRLVLVEEVHVTKRTINKNIQEPVTLMKEKVTVEHIALNNRDIQNDKQTDNHKPA